MSMLVFIPDTLRLPLANMGTTGWMFALKKIVVNGSMFRWRQVMNGVPQKSILELIEFKIFIN